MSFTSPPEQRLALYTPSNPGHQTDREYAQRIGSNTASIQTQQQLTATREKRFLLCHKMLGTIGGKYSHLITDFKKLHLNISEVRKLNSNLFDQAKSRLLDQMAAIGTNSTNQFNKYKHNYDTFVTNRRKQWAVTQRVAPLTPKMKKSIEVLTKLERACGQFATQLNDALNQCQPLLQKVEEHKQTHLELKRLQTQLVGKVEQLTQDLQAAQTKLNDQLTPQVSAARNELTRCRSSLESANQRGRDVSQELQKDLNVFLMNLVISQSNLSSPTDVITLSSRIINTLGVNPHDQSIHYNANSQTLDALDLDNLVQSVQLLGSEIATAQNTFTTTLRSLETELGFEQRQLTNARKEADALKQQQDELEAAITELQTNSQFFQQELQDANTSIVNIEQLGNSITAFYSGDARRNTMIQQRDSLERALQTQQQQNQRLNSFHINSLQQFQTQVNILRDNNGKFFEARSQLNDLTQSAGGVLGGPNDFEPQLTQIAQLQSSRELSQQQYQNALQTLAAVENPSDAHQVSQDDSDLDDLLTALEAELQQLTLERHQEPMDRNIDTLEIVRKGLLEPLTAVVDDLDMLMTGIDIDSFQINDQLIPNPVDQKAAFATLLQSLTARGFDQSKPQF